MRELTMMAVEETYVSHGSTTKTLSLSTLLKHCFQKTILRFLYGMRSILNHDLSTGREARASCGCPFATEHLKRTVYRNEAWSNEITDVSLCSFHLAFGEAQLQSDVRRCILLRTGRMPKSCRILSVDTFPSNQMVKQNIITIMQVLRTFHYYLHIAHEAMNHTQRLCDSHTSLVCVNRSNLIRTASTSHSPNSFLVNFSMAQ